MSDNGVEIVGGHWAPIPEALLFDTTISAHAVRVYGILMRYGNTPGSCYPSRSTIAERMGASERSVPAWLTELEEAGWMDRVPRFRPDGGQTSNGYRLYLTPRSPTSAPTPTNDSPPTPPDVPPPTLTNDAKESQEEREPVERESGYARGQQTLVAVPEAPPAVPDRMTARQLDDAFTAWWAVYPRRAGKGAARTAFAKAARKVPVEVLMSGAERYRDDPNRTEEFTAHPSTWLNQERWGDDPLPVRGSSGPPPSRTAVAMQGFRRIASEAAERDRARAAGLPVGGVTDPMTGLAIGAGR